MSGNVMPATGQVAKTEDVGADRRRRLLDLAAVALCVYFAGYVGWRIFGWGGEELALAINDFMLIPIGVTCVVFGLLAWKGLRPGRSRRGWLFLSLAFAAYALGDMTWFHIEIIQGLEVPYPSIADAAYLAYYPLALIGLSSLTARRGVRGDLFGLDLAIVTVAAGTIIFVAVLGPLVDSLAWSPEGVALALAYPIGDTVVLFAASAALMRNLTDTPRLVVLLLAAGMSANVVADLAYVSLSLQDAHESGMWIDTAYMVGWLLTALAAWLQARRSSRRTQETVAPAATMPHLPYVAVATLYGVLVMTSAESGSHVRALVYGAVIITVLVLARQFLLGRENGRLQAAHAAQRMESRFRSLVQHASDVIAITDRKGTVSYVTPSVSRLLDRTPESLVGRPLWEMVTGQEQSVQTFLLAAAEGPGTSGPVEWQVEPSGSEARAFDVTATNLCADPDINGLVVTLRDITERQAFERTLERQAFHDPLTGLPNRLLLADRLALAIRRSRRHTGKPGVIYLDLDDFKRVNDTRGHVVGDRVLVEVASRLAAAIRDGDTAARLGGDEFAILLEETEDIDEVARTAERIATQLRKPIDLDQGAVIVSASMGIVRADNEAATTVQLLRDADISMYAAKQGARGSYRLFQATMAAEAEARVAIEEDLVGALERNELRIVYQPVLALASGEVIGVEALLRWTHPQRGEVPPIEFIPVAERTGLIIPIGQWVLEDVCRTVARWNQDLRRPIRASVNVSLRQFDPSFPGIVEGALARTGMPSEQLILELTESMVGAREPGVRSVLDGLRQLGVRISVDDFGTGYSSLSYLNELPIDEIKIDRSFVGTLTERSDTCIVGAIIALAQGLGVPTVAEGIELEVQAALLREMGCDLGQGYLFGRPVDPDVLFAWLQPAQTAREVPPRTRASAAPA
jgi:diguanylate cyclase (GGDEF)-like protein/PAS domain S-box-containing protein